MQRFYVFLGRHAPEVWALFLVAITLFLGCFAAWTSQPIWLNRAGAIIVIIGVLLAATRYHEWVRSKFLDFVDHDSYVIAKTMVEISGREAGQLSEEQHLQIIAEVRAKALAELDKILENDKKRIKNLEIVLVVVGTFLNGMGDYIISLLK